MWSFWLYFECFVYKKVKVFKVKVKMKYYKQNISINFCLIINSDVPICRVVNITLDLIAKLNYTYTSVTLYK